MTLRRRAATRIAARSRCTEIQGHLVFLRGADREDRRAGGARRGCRDSRFDVAVLSAFEFPRGCRSCHVEYGGAAVPIVAGWCVRDTGGNRLRAGVSPPLTMCPPKSCQPRCALDVRACGRRCVADAAAGGRAVGGLARVSR